MVKRIVGWVILLPLFAVLIVFALANRQSVAINFNPFAPDAAAFGVPLFVVLFAVLLIGVIMGGIATWFAQGAHRRDERRFRRENERLHRELEVARRSTAVPVDSDDFVRSS